METTVAEIADKIYRLSTFVPEVTPRGFTFNQFLIDADAPLLFHCGMRAIFPLVSAAVSRLVPLGKLRWVSFAHVESDESGALNQWLAAAPAAEVVHSPLACQVSVRDLADRPPVALEDGAVLDLGGRRVLLLTTPHVPHNWESISLFEETTGTLLCGDILTTTGDGPAMSGESPVDAVLEDERMFRAWSLGPGTEAVLRRLAALEPKTLASMHGRSFHGDGGRVLRDIAEGMRVIAKERAAER